MRTIQIKKILKIIILIHNQKNKAYWKNIKIIIIIMEVKLLIIIKLMKQQKTVKT